MIMSSQSQPVGFLARGGLWVLAQFALMVAGIGLGVVFPGDRPSGLFRLLGLSIIALGGWFGIAGAKALGRNRTAYPRPVAEGALIQHGIYARVRHPLYTSVILIGLGWAALWGSWPAIGLISTVGLTLSIIRAKTDSLFPSFVVHLAYNTTISILFIIGVFVGGFPA